MLAGLKEDWRPPLKNDGAAAFEQRLHTDFSQAWNWPNLQTLAHLSLHITTTFRSFLPRSEPAIAGFISHLETFPTSFRTVFTSP